MPIDLKIELKNLGSHRFDPLYQGTFKVGLLLFE
jgi:hypothetical protein